MEIRKREAKVFLMSKQIEDNEDTLQGAGKENDNLKHEDYVTFVTSVDKCKFRYPVFPGTRLRLEAKLAKRKMNHMFYDCKVFDNETRVASATVGLTAKKL